VSTWFGQRKLDQPELAEQHAVALLAGVGGEVEWWLWNPQARVGHLRVPIVERELRYCPSGIVVTDAGESGPQRPRTRV
jgi:hypothetical protein